MRKTIVAVSATGALLFGGAGVANASIDNAPVPSSTTTTVADHDNDQTSDNNGLWGLVGLLGLGGLAGLMRRRETPSAGGTIAPGRGQTP